MPGLLVKPRIISFRKKIILILIRGHLAGSGVGRKLVFAEDRLSKGSPSWPRRESLQELFASFPGHPLFTPFSGPPALCSPQWGGGSLLSPGGASDPPALWGPRPSTVSRPLPFSAAGRPVPATSFGSAQKPSAKYFF